VGKKGVLERNAMFVADFETTDTDIFYKIDKPTGTPIYEQRVWLAGYKNLETLKTRTFTHLDGFMNALMKEGNKAIEVAFHNLKYDGSYIVPWLIKNGYNVTHDKPEAGEYSILVDERNNWYSITFKPNARKKVTIWDSFKLFPMKLADLPDLYHTPTRKIEEGEDFYNKERGSDYKLTTQDLDYFENDLQVPAEVLNKHIDRYGIHFKKTQASQAFHNFVQSFKTWKKAFPPLTNEVDQVIRPAYWGGISYVPPHKSGKDYFNIGVYDINSSYPDKAGNYKLPYGYPMKEYGEGLHPDVTMFWVAEAIMTFSLKKNHLPCIPAKAIEEGDIIEDRSGMDKWLSDSGGLVKMRFSNIDYMNMQESYHCKVIRWKWSIHWKWKVHRQISNFVHTNNDIKVQSTIRAKETNNPSEKIECLVKRNRSKVDNNSFYGKFGEEVIKEGKTPYPDDKKGVIWKVDRMDEASDYTRKFLPIAIAITAWGRNQLLKMANILGEDFLYCDTDSIHYLKGGGQCKIDKAIKEGHFEVHPTKLGAWDFEGDYDKGRYLRAKCYMEEKNGTIEATVAGLPADKGESSGSKKRSCLNWDNFYIGAVIPHEQTNKLRTVSTPTGNKLVATSFKIKQNDNLL